MQQTMLAFLALMIILVHSFMQQQMLLHTYREITDDEMEIMASGVALHVMEMIGGQPFDERTTPVNIQTYGLPAGVDDFTPRADFGSDTACDLDEPFLNTAPACDDLDDAHMDALTWQTVPFRFQDGRRFDFEVNVQVAYVEADDWDTPADAAVRTNYKRVLVRLRSPQHVAQGRYADGFVQLERIFAYNSEKALDDASS
jgi:hypothetical protein